MHTFVQNRLSAKNKRGCYTMRVRGNLLKGTLKILNKLLRGDIFSVCTNSKEWKGHHI